MQQHETGPTSSGDAPAAGQPDDDLRGEPLFLARLELIDRVIGWVCARRGLRGPDAEDFASMAKLRLIEHDYEVLRRYAGRSSLKTYLTAVLSRVYLDFQAQRFGKWRPSAEARRLGPIALRLELLLHRDGLTFDEAGSVLLADPRVACTQAALDELRGRLPRRAPRGAAIEAREPWAVHGGTLGIERSERQALADRVFDAIREALGDLSARERLVLRLHFESALTLADVARTLGLEQKALYRGRDDLLKRLRARLARRGIGAREARELLATLDWQAALDVPVAEKIGSQTDRERVAGPGLGPVLACELTRRLRTAGHAS
jgi:RNA polymerase sigma factor for flagellar operon FliA